MFMEIIVGISIAVFVVGVYIINNLRKTEMQRYYDAAHKILKETCLNYAIKNKSPSDYGGQKIMLYLKWKDQEKQGYVFNPEEGIRIGRTPGENEICIREETVSSRQCILYLANGQPAIQDYNSVNGTWIRRGFFKHQVRGAELIFSGDCILVGNMKIKVTVFVFDMAYM